MALLPRRGHACSVACHVRDARRWLPSRPCKGKGVHAHLLRLPVEVLCAPVVLTITRPFVLLRIDADDGIPLCKEERHSAGERLERPIAVGMVSFLVHRAVRLHTVAQLMHHLAPHLPDGTPDDPAGSVPWPMDGHACLSTAAATLDLRASLAGSTTRSRSSCRLASVLTVFVRLPPILRSPAERSAAPGTCAGAGRCGSIREQREPPLSHGFKEPVRKTQHVRRKRGKQSGGQPGHVGNSRSLIRSSYCTQSSVRGVSMIWLRRGEAAWHGFKW